MGNGRQARLNSFDRALNQVREFLLAHSTPGLYRKKRKACQDDNHFNSYECKRCGGALDIQSPGRPRGTTASDGYGVSCSCDSYE